MKTFQTFRRKRVFLLIMPLRPEMMPPKPEMMPLIADYIVNTIFNNVCLALYGFSEGVHA
jgi:hypothetical protein